MILTGASQIRSLIVISRKSITLVVYDNAVPMFDEIQLGSVVLILNPCTALSISYSLSQSCVHFFTHRVVLKLGVTGVGFLFEVHEYGVSA